MKEQVSTFIIAREDKGLDPTTLVAEGLKIGRYPGRDLLLNHPDVSRLHAGIKEIEGRFYLFNLSSTNTTTLNGRLVPVGEPEALASGDEVRIGPFFLRVERRDEALELTVTLQFGLRIGDIEAREESAGTTLVGTQLGQTTMSGLRVGQTTLGGVRDAAAPAADAVAQALDLFWGKRSRDKAARKSPLHPRRPPRLGKARFNWTATRDLLRPWPFAVFLWSVVVLGVLSIAAAFAYTSAYAPEPVSNPHSRATLSLTPAVAREPNAGSCMNCHSLKTGMASACASCHTTEAFVGTVTMAHAGAGIGCIDCHSEHKGKAVGPMQAALNSCTRCHSDKNRKTFNGKTVGTPHGGTLGYPVINGQWKWPGLDPDELATRPKVVALHLPADTDQLWRSKQFHALHVYSVKATGGVIGVAGTEAGAPPVLSCSSCHRSLSPVDREYPRQTCGQCHSGLIDPSGRASVAAGAPNCISCHVQHIKDKRHWNPELLVKK